MPLVEKWWREHMNKVVEQEAFIDSVSGKSAELKGTFLFEVFMAFSVSLV